MINIVFLLLVFFMLAGALEVHHLFEIDPLEARTGDAAERPEAVVIVDRQGRLAFEGRERDRDGLRRALAARLADRPETVIHLKADGRTSTPEVVEVLEVMRAAGVERLVLLAREP